MIAMDDIRVEFNGVDLLAQYNIGHVSVDGPQTHIFAASKSIQTASPIYRNRQILTASMGEPLNFSLTFAPMDGEEWSDELVNAIYQLFDVKDYKPLRFGGEEMYYNVLPFSGSVSEMRLFAMNGGYVTIPFQCDAPHGWIDREYHFTRDEAHAAWVWQVDNPCNVKDALGTYRVYPYIVLKNFDTTSGIDSAFVSFGRASDIDGAIGDAGWYNLAGIPTTVIGDESREYHLDCYNQQVYSIGSNTVNLLNYMKDNEGNEDLRFFYLEGGHNYIYHRSIISNEIQYIGYYDIDIYMSCPYMK